ncbi:MAG: SGNH/GDSL hydrolase family protein [Nodosilinea sp.]
MTIALLGDSLLDTGNLTSILAPFGIVPFPDLPFPDPPYSGGKASNGLVLGEAVMAQLALDPGSLKLGVRLPTTPPTLNPLTENINYAVAGATTGIFGPEGNGLENFPVGVQSQIALFTQDLASVGIPEAKVEKPDILFSAGSNDVFEALVDINSFANILSTPSQDDDNALRNDLASQVVGNIYTAVGSLENYVDDIVILGLSKLGDSPFSIQTDGIIDALLPGNYAGQTRAFLTSVAAEINTRLIDTYDGDGDGDRRPDLSFNDLAKTVGNNAAQALDDLEGFSQRAVNFGSSLFSNTGFSLAFDDLVDDLLGSNVFDQANDLLVGLLDDVDDYLQGQCGGSDPVGNVMVIDGIDVFEDGLANWQMSVFGAGLTPITEISYLDYLTQFTGLPVGLDSRSFAFTDGSHPTSDLSQFIAAQIAPQIQAEFADFGMG